MNKKFGSVLVSVCAVLFLFAGCGQVNALENAAKLATNYDITATLDYENKTLDATENVRYINTSKNELNELKFHLYPNAFRADADTYKAVNETQKPRAYPNGFSEGHIIINKVTITGKEIDFAITGEDENILTVPLDSVLRPNSYVDVIIEFDLLIPNCNHRFGYGENTLNLGNWYPIACVFEDGEFATDGYSPNGDPFYSDISNYNVKHKLL